MDDLLPYYETELALMREQARGFAERYPKIAGRLQLSQEVAADPHVERLIESFALLTARIHKRLDDDFPQVTETLLDVLYPHYLRPLPSASVMQLGAPLPAPQTQPDGGSEGHDPKVASTWVPRGTALTTAAVRGVACRFRTCAELTVLPIELVSASFRSSLAAPAGTALPERTTSMLSLRFEPNSAQSKLAGHGIERLRVYVDGDAAQVSALREALALRSVCVFVQTESEARWSGPLRSADNTAFALPRLAGFAADEAMLDADPRAHPVYRLLSEYFAFPEKFNFIDLPWPPDALLTTRSVVLHVLFAESRGDADHARLLEGVSARQLALGCVPVVNLFAAAAEPVQVTHRRAAYPLTVKGQSAWAYEIHSIDSVVRQGRGAEGPVEYRSFYSLRHADGDSRARYWHAHRDDGAAARTPGYEVELSIIDADFEPDLELPLDTLSVSVTATNRDLPTQLAIGNPAGDGRLDGGSRGQAVRLLRRPTPTLRFAQGHNALWRMISHLKVNYLSLDEDRAESLRGMLGLYDFQRSASARRQIDGIVSITSRRATAWLPGKPFASFVNGIEVCMTLDEEAFVGSGMAVFVELMDRFFGLYVHVNSYTQLVIKGARNGSELLRRAPRSGELPLI